MGALDIKLNKLKEGSLNLEVNYIYMMLQIFKRE